MGNKQSGLDQATQLMRRTTVWTTASLTVGLFVFLLNSRLSVCLQLVVVS